MKPISCIQKSSDALVKNTLSISKLSNIPWTSSRKHRGFALVVTLLMMVLLSILTIGMLSLSAISLRSGNASSEIEEARANARMGLMLAIGELQKSMGPDRRISARALTLAQDARIGTTLSPNSPRSWWVGVTGTNPAFGLNAVSSVSASNPAAIWLVSGLDSNSSPSNQLSQPFADPVDLLGDYSLDLSMTGGEPITAGIVRVLGSNQNRIGGYAWIIDDEGMKAQLAPSNAELVNTTMPPNRSVLTPGAYDVSVLDGMSNVQGNPLSNYWKILSTGDLALLEGGDLDLATSKRFSYTTFSRGVLCDVVNGGLKQDLTAAFENDATFNTVFPAGNTADYLLIDCAKLASCSDLQQNGYIHWDVFKDHYNIKRYIKTASDGTHYLDPVRFSKAGVYTANNGFHVGANVNPLGEPFDSGAGSLFMAGRLGPHDISNAATSKYPQMNGVPYGDYKTDDNNPRQPRNHAEFKHSPVIPILQRLQTNSWIEQIDARTLRTHAQVWSSHYNPYNISLFVMGWHGGPRVHGVPQTRAFMTPNLTFNRKESDGSIHPQRTRLDQVYFIEGKKQFESKNPVMLLPGRSHVLGYDSSAHIDDSSDSFLYSDAVKDLTVESVYRDMVCEQNLPASISLKFTVGLQSRSFHHGVGDNNGGPGNMEVCQSFWAPFAWEREGKVFEYNSVPTSSLNENLRASFEFNLRTTHETDSDIRPLVDANIRCMLGNTRWDSPMNLPLLASYSAANQGVPDDMIMQMDTVDDPKGYSYWGADRDSSSGHSRVILFDIPRSDLVSLGQLQHAGAGRFSYEPTYIVGNSYANPRIQQANWKDSITDTFSTYARDLELFPINGSFNLYDASYLVNEVLWDRYTFTTIPQVADNLASPSITEPTPNASHFEALAKGQQLLPNARYLTYTPLGSKFDIATLQMASNRINGTGAFYHNAGHLLVDGAFNVNSTSIDAWEAFLSSTHSLPVAKVNAKSVITGYDMADSVRFPRVQSVFGEGDKIDDLDENFWVGYRELEQSQVRSLAQAIVDEVKQRGPFLSMAEFVNRKLVSEELGESGALQAALDKTVNTGIDSDYASGKQAAGFPGHLLQGDVLQALAPYMTVRSDVFTIRAYGETKDANGKVLAQAWCEAKVQRFPDPVNSGSTGGAALSELSNPSSPFGRQFRIISFRWLNSKEI